MKRTEDAANQFHVVPTVVQFKQGGLEVDQDLARFFAECLAELVSSGL